MSEIKVIVPGYMKTEIDKIKINLSSYSGYTNVTNSLNKFCSKEIVAGLIGCIIPESGSDPTILNSREFKGNGAQGTEGWNCGEGLVQWTYWKYKLPLIQVYNEDSRSTQKLPTTWDVYSQGDPIERGGRLYAQQDGKHIAGLSMDNHMLFLTKYYEKLINQLQGETNLAVIVAKIYQQKAGSGFYKDISNPIVRAYTTSKNKYPSSTGNHYLQSLKIAQQYLNCPIETTNKQSLGVDYVSSSIISSTNRVSLNNESTTSNVVSKLGSASKRNEILTKQDANRKEEFESLRNKMSDAAPKMGREILKTSELYDSNILKGDQEARKEKI